MKIPAPRNGNPFFGGGRPQRLGETWIESESFAYTSPSGSVHGSERKGYVRFADGKLRIVKLGVPDTYFTIPAKPSHGPVGFVTVEGENHAEYTFHVYTGAE